MMGKLLSLVLAALFTLSLTGSIFADEVKGRIAKVEERGRSITVKAKDGKELTVRISGSRTELQGISDRSEFKEGQSVAVTYEGGEAKKVSVSKSK